MSCVKKRKRVKVIRVHQDHTYGINEEKENAKKARGCSEVSVVKPCNSKRMIDLTSDTKVADLNLRRDECLRKRILIWQLMERIRLESMCINEVEARRCARGRISQCIA